MSETIEALRARLDETRKRENEAILERRRAEADLVKAEGRDDPDARYQIALAYGTHEEAHEAWCVCMVSGLEGFRKRNRQEEADIEAAMAPPKPSPLATAIGVACAPTPEIAERIEGE